MLVLAYLANLVFALTYNVGDTHVFLLPSHLMLGIFAAGGAAVLLWATLCVRIRGATAVVGILCLAYAAQRGWDAWPAVDRSGDNRPKAFLDELVTGVTTDDALFGIDMNWQTDNAVDYYMKYERPDIAWFRADEVLSHFPALFLDNAAIGRTVLATRATADQLLAAHPGRFRADPDPRVVISSLTEVVERFPAGTPYVLTYLRPTRESLVDGADVSGAVTHLTGGTYSWADPPCGFQTLAGVVGGPPAAAECRDRPYRIRAEVAGLQVEARMESWLPADTIRRAGFGHVLVGRRHTLTLERGISFVALDAAGHPICTAYRAGVLAPQPRYVIRARR
jgi:hypothetical protein